MFIILSFQVIQKRKYQNISPTVETSAPTSTSNRDNTTPTGQYLLQFLFSEYLSCVTLFYSDDVSVRMKMLITLIKKSYRTTIFSIFQFIECISCKIILLWVNDLFVNITHYLHIVRVCRKIYISFTFVVSTCEFFNILKSCQSTTESVRKGKCLFLFYSVIFYFLQFHTLFDR